MQIVERKTEDLVPYARNSRTHSEEQVAQIAASIKEFGFTNPVLIDESNGIIAGHGRLLAAQKLGIGELPCVVLEGLSETQRRAYVIVDNKLALNAGWDEEFLGVELQTLLEDDFDLDLIGFTAAELEDLLPEEEKETDDESQENVPSTYEIVIECSDEQQQQQVFEIAEERGWSCRVLSI
jgi:ParB-like chromosome segregation protein Spo0J